MKRSEMIAKLRDYFFGEEIRPEPFCGFSNKFIEDFSDSILTFLENQGMQPPAYSVQEKTGPYVIQEYTVYNKWEDEA